MQIIDLLTIVTDELRDKDGRKYSKASQLLKLKEATTQFAQDSALLKNSVQILPSPNTAVYNLPIYGRSFSDWTDVASTGTPDTRTTHATYLSTIRMGWTGKSTTSGKNKVLQANSTFERDEAGMPFYKTGTPNYLYNDELSFHQFGVWPIPDATAIDTLVTNPSTGQDNRIQLDYVRNALYYTDLAWMAITNEATREAARQAALVSDPKNITENDYMDPDIVEHFQEKLYLLICYHRLKNSIDPTDVAKAARYKELYVEELLKPALESGNHMDRYNQISVSS